MVGLHFQYGNREAVSNTTTVLRGDAAEIGDAYTKLFNRAMLSLDNDTLILECMTEISDSARQLTTKQNRISQRI